MRSCKVVLLATFIITLFLSLLFFICYDNVAQYQLYSHSINKCVTELEDETSHDHSLFFSGLSEGKICNRCGGTGRVLIGLVSKNVTCPACNGTGQVLIGATKMGLEYGTCSLCNGTKEITRTFPEYGTCPDCNGTGFLQVSKKENISTPEISEELPTTEVVIVTSAAAGAAVLLGFLATEWGRYKFLSFLPFLGPLYLRTVKEDVFDNQKRLCMYDHIAENQPVVYSEIKKTCNLSDGEINWHARMMIQLDLIKTERKGFHLFFYLAKSPRLPPEEFIRLTDTQKSIYDLIFKKPGINQVEIVEKIGLKQQNISYNLLKLEEKGKIRVEKKGTVKLYYSVKRDSSSI